MPKDGLYNVYFAITDGASTTLASIGDTVPAAENAEENVWHMVKNAETGQVLFSF